MKKIVLLASILLLSACAYYNTFFNAEKRYKEAFEKQKTVKTDRLPTDVTNNYNAAIKKCWNLIDVYGDSNKYADDALLMIGQSHHNLKEYQKSQRVFEQFLLRYPDSDLVPEVKLWLAKSYIAEERDDEALSLLDDLINAKISNSIASQIYFNLGDLYYERELFDKSLENFTKTVDITNDEEILGNAYFKMGEIYFNDENYPEAIKQFKELEDLDIPIQKEFDARTQQAEAYIELEEYDKAESILKKMLRDIRFKDQYALIDTRIGNLSEAQENYDFARMTYYDVLSKYKKNDGTALASFYLAQLYEFEYSDFDSAKSYYEKVGNLKLFPEIAETSKQKSNLLKEYLKIRNQLRKDRDDLLSLARGDSLLEDSLVVDEGPDTEMTPPEEESDERGDKKQKDAPEPFGNPFNMNKNLQADQNNVDSTQTENRPPDGPPQPKAKKKVAITRTAEQVNESYFKNSFSIAEFFLLKYENFDSAEASYKRFISDFPEDTVLTPKAAYALYFVYHDKLNMEHKADSMRSIILENYPDSPYGYKLSGRVVNIEPSLEKDVQNQEYKDIYLKAEEYMFSGEYDLAIESFLTIAEKDSGSLTAQKARYSIAYLYEHFLADIPKAISAYQDILKEYPNTDFGKIAKNKTEEPVIEEPVISDSTATAITDSSTTTDQSDELKDLEEQDLDVREKKLLEKLNKENNENENTIERPFKDPEKKTNDDSNKQLKEKDLNR